MRRLARIGVVVAVVIGVWYLVAPMAAAHFGYGTRWPRRMPSILHFNGRDYNNPGDCLTRAKTPFGMHHPHRIGAIPVVLGDDAPILVPNPWRASDPAPVILTVEQFSGCFLVYQLEGGP